MTRVAITGHRGIAGALARTITDSMRATLLPYAREPDNLIGISCLADGADQYFARTVLALGGRLEAVVLDCAEPPSLPADEGAEYERLVGLCTTVTRIPCERANGAAHLRASMTMVDSCDVLIAVWDGLPARGVGGTADVVAYAQHKGVPTAVIWPPGAVRQWPIRQATGPGVIQER